MKSASKKSFLILIFVSYLYWIKSFTVYFFTCLYNINFHKFFHPLQFFLIIFLYYTYYTQFLFISKRKISSNKWIEKNHKYYFNYIIIFHEIHGAMKWINAFIHIFSISHHKFSIRSLSFSLLLILCSCSKISNR